MEFTCNFLPEGDKLSSVEESIFNEQGRPSLGGVVGNFVLDLRLWLVPGPDLERGG
jgi:hypothetical protein